MAVAKRTGTNAVTVAQGIIDKLNQLRPEVIPPAIRVKVTRDYGATADEKVNELMRELLIAVLSITVLLTLFLGWREALIVALAVPLTLALTLTGNMMFGYTINRVTLFALILSLGLLVDDEFIYRRNLKQCRLLQRAKLKFPSACLEEIDYRAPRGLIKSKIVALQNLEWLNHHQNILITGPSGVGKSHLACALGQWLCRNGRTVLYSRWRGAAADLGQRHHPLHANALSGKRRGAVSG